MSADGKIAFCMRVESNRKAKNGAWVHRLSEPIQVPKVTHKKEKPLAQPEIIAKAVEYYERCEHPELLSNKLGITVESLRREGLGYDGRNWSFPMFNEHRQIIGVKLRPPHGKKFCVPGSHLGINWPKGLTGESPLLVCEGETDCGAGLDMEFDAIGRPSCSAGTGIIQGFLARHRYEEVWIIADSDSPGIEGAERLAEAIKDWSNIKLIYPPFEKDLRVWYNDGVTRGSIIATASNKLFWSQ